MKGDVKKFIGLVLVYAVLLMTAGFAFGQITKGQQAPEFSLQDTNGEEYALDQVKDRPMTILYFFDVASRPSQDGLFTLGGLLEKYAGWDTVVWGITAAKPQAAADFVKKAAPPFPVLLDTSDVSDSYQARSILPTVCILGPGQKVLDVFRGGGKTTEVMLVRLAERSLQRKETAIAKALSETVEKTDPNNVQAKLVKGYASLKEGKMDAAEKTFNDLAKVSPQADILAKEALSSLYAKKGDDQKALALVKEVEAKAPDRGFVHVVKGDVLYRQNKPAEAAAEFKQAIAKKEVEPFQQAIAYNQLGRVLSNKGELEEARRLYTEAEVIDPYYVEATSNKGVTYEKEGRWDMALDSYRKALAVDRSQDIAAILARKAERMLALQKDTASKERMDKLVKELAERFRSQQALPPEEKDEWTSRPMVLSFVDVNEVGGLSPQDGMSLALVSQLTDQLNASGRVHVVERALMEQLLQELNLGSSELADPATALRLGRILAAKLIGTGSLLFMPDGTLLNLRLVDTETSGIASILSQSLGQGDSFEQNLNRLNRDILTAIIDKYPLQGYVVNVNDKQIMANLGSNQGVVTGTAFEVLEEKPPIEYKGRMLQQAAQPVAVLEVVKVEPDLCYAKIVRQDRPLHRDDKIREQKVALPMTGEKP